MAIADLVLRNGKICTVDQKFSFCEALAVKDGWIIDVGTSAEMERHIGEHTQVIDLEGKLVLPGMHDAHLHACYAGLALGENFVDANDEAVTDLVELNRRLAAVAARVPKGAWIVGTGFKRDMLKECAERGTFINRYDIDVSTPDHPVMLTDGGLHRVLINSKALEICGLTKDTPDFKPEVGYMHRFENGEPTGLFEEFGCQAVIGAAAHHLTDAELEECILRMQKHLNQFGCTSHTDIVGVGGDDLFLGAAGERAIHIYEKLAREGKLTARVNVEVLPGMHAVQSYDAITEGLDQTTLPEFHDRNWVRADTVKIFGDDAWKRDDNPSLDRGYSYFPGATAEEQADNMRRTLIEVHRRGWQMGIHLTGGKAIDIVVDALAEAQRLYPRESPRHFLIHGNELTTEGAKKCATYHIGISDQAIAPYCFAPKCDVMLSEEELDQAYYQKRYAEMGVNIAHGSDGPALSMNWLKGLRFLLTRLNRAGDPVYPQLTVPMEEAIRMYTINGARQEHMEGVMGSLEVNKLADLQVLDRDIFEMPPKDVDQAKIVMTICNGKIVYTA